MLLLRICGHCDDRDSQLCGLRLGVCAGGVAGTFPAYTRLSVSQRLGAKSKPAGSKDHPFEHVLVELSGVGEPEVPPNA